MEIPRGSGECPNSGEVHMFAARSQDATYFSRWRPQASIARFRTHARAGLASPGFRPHRRGLVALGLLTVALWSPFSNATAGCRTSPLVFAGCRCRYRDGGRARQGLFALCKLRFGRHQFAHSQHGAVRRRGERAGTNGRHLSLARGVQKKKKKKSGDDTVTFTLAGKVKQDLATMTVKVRISVK